MAKLITVIGVTGQQGSSVAETFLQLPDWRVRGITRNLSSKASLALAAKGVELVKADLNNKETLVPAFEGSNIVFCNTDFFAFLFDPAAASSGQSPIQYAYDGEVRQGLNAAEAASSPAVLKTLERFIYSSLSDATKWTNGRITSLKHFECKTETLRIIEERFPELAARLSTVQLGHYVTNWKSIPSMAPQRQADGSYVLTRPAPGDAVMPWVVTHRDTGAFVKALVDAPAGTALAGFSEPMSHDEWMAVWGRTLGVKASYKEISKEEFFRDMPEIFRTEMWDGWDYLVSPGLTGGDPKVLSTQQLDPNMPLTTMEEYVRSEDWSSVLTS